MIKLVRDYLKSLKKTIDTGSRIYIIDPC